MSSYNESGQESLRIGYSDPHAMNNISRTLTLLQQENEQIRPRFTLDQTNANLARLERGQLDIIISMKDHSYKNKDIEFSELIIDRFFCVVNKAHTLASDSKNNTVDTDDFKMYPQVIAIPSYLRTSNYLNHHSLIPIEENVENIMTANAPESYALVLAGYGFALIPGHLLMPHPDLIFLNWKTSPTSPMGIYHRKGSAKENPAISRFLQVAKKVYAEKQ